MRKINIEEETIEIGDLWKSAVTLKEDIKGKIEIGNFDITAEALALRELTSTLEKYSAVGLKLPNDFIDTSRAKAGDMDISFEEYLRTLLLDGTERVAVKAEPEEEEEEEEEESAEIEEKVSAEVEEKKEEKEEAKPHWDGEEEAEKEEEDEEEEEGEEDEEDEEEEQEQQIVKVRCHNCKRPITISSSKRPITVTCPNCGAKGRLE